MDENQAFIPRKKLSKEDSITTIGDSLKVFDAENENISFSEVCLFCKSHIKKLKQLVASQQATILTNKAEQEARLCVICTEQVKTVVLLPCRHLCVCEECGLDELMLSKCPMCSKDIKSRMSLFV